jgi:hypothetical protein
VPAARIVYDRDHFGVSSIRGDEVRPFALAMTGIAVAMIRIWGAAMRQSAKSKRQKSDGGVLSHYSCARISFLTAP